MADLFVDISYSQLAIFCSSLDQPFNSWSERHVAQGFSWRPGSACFRTLVESGRHRIEVSVVDYLGSVDPKAVRVIDVPFEVPANGEIEFASISDAVPLKLPSGNFLLRCEFLPSSSSEAQQVRCLFARRENPRFEIVVADAALSVGAELVETADPA